MTKSTASPTCVGVIDASPWKSPPESGSRSLDPAIQRPSVRAVLPRSRGRRVRHGPGYCDHAIAPSDPVDEDGTDQHLRPGDGGVLADRGAADHLRGHPADRPPRSCAQPGQRRATRPPMPTDRPVPRRPGPGRGRDQPLPGRSGPAGRVAGGRPSSTTGGHAIPPFRPAAAALKTEQQCYVARTPMPIGSTGVTWAPGRRRWRHTDCPPPGTPTPRNPHHNPPTPPDPPIDLPRFIGSRPHADQASASGVRQGQPGPGVLKPTCGDRAMRGDPRQGPDSSTSSCRARCPCRTEGSQWPTNQPAEGEARPSPPRTSSHAVWTERSPLSGQSYCRSRQVHGVHRSCLADSGSP